MLNGTTYMVRPCIEPRNSSCILVRISAGSSQWFVGPASASRSEQMNVRSSTRATSLGSVVAQNDPGRRLGSSSTKVPASTSCFESSSNSSSEPSNQWIVSGSQSAATSSTHSSNFRLVVGALRVSDTGTPGPDEAGAPRSGGGTEGSSLPPYPRNPAAAVSELNVGRHPHVGLRADPNASGPPGIVELEVHPLPLTQQAEQRPLQRVEREHVLGPVGIGHDEAFSRERIERANDALQGGPPSPSQGFCTLPALRQEVHTWRRRGAPFTIARTFCTLGFHRRFDRRCEWLSCMPKRG